MSLNNIFQMIKADRYTADGREEIKKALTEETEDRTYNIGEISEKTGLQKTANGWVKPEKVYSDTPSESKPEPSKEEKREVIAKQKFDSVKEGDDVTAYGFKVKIVKKYPGNNSVDVEFKDSKGEKQISHLSILDIDDDSFNKKETGRTGDSAPRELTGDCKIRIRK